MIKSWATIEGCLKYFCRKVARRKADIDSPPIFIVGCGHSGTSLLLAILDSHSRIHAIPGETKIAIRDNRIKFKWALKRFDGLAIRAGKRRWAEKTPNHIYRIGKILEWCPDAKILLVIRDGRDVAVSLQKRTGSLETGIRRWVEDNLAGKDYWKHANVCIVRYEDLVRDFESSVTDVLDFLNENYEPAMKSYYQVPRTWYSKKIEKPQTAIKKNHRQHRNWQINQPLFDGRGRWKNLSNEELSLVNDIAGEMLAEFGYAGIGN